MSKVKSKNTKPELTVRTALHRLGYRFRLHDNSLPGNPDIILKKYNTVIFVNGCFWHGHSNCKYAGLPKTSTDWWERKILATSKRDKKNKRLLRLSGWKVITVYECGLKGSKKTTTIDRITRSLN